VRDWRAFVRARLSLPNLTPERETRIIRELAAQLEDFYRDARARGATTEDAEAHACAQIRDWEAFARDVQRADTRHALPRIARLIDAIDRSPHTTRGARRMLANLLTDTRYATRQMLKTPGFTLVAVLTLAFGIGATTAIFSVVNGVLLRPLPYPQSETLVRVFEVVPRYGRFSVSPANFLDWRQRQTVFERIAAYAAGGSDTFMGFDGPERVPRALVSWDLFDLLRVTPALGRGFRADEDQPNQNNVIVLSHVMWQNRFGGDPNVLGRSVQLSGTPATVVGVMPAGFYFPTRDAEFWRPIAFNPATAPRGAHFIGVIARLKPDVSLQQAGAEMQAIAGQLAQQYPQSNRDESAEAVALLDVIVGPIRPMLFTLLGAVVVVVLIACANVANLLLVRASVREKEIAIRVAMGASSRRLVLQMLSESVLLALVGGGFGVLLAWLAMRPIQALSAGRVPRIADVTLDGNVLAFGLLVSCATGLLFGVAPAWQTLGGKLGVILKEGGRTSTSSRGGRLRAGMLIGEVALSIVLLVGAALLLRSFAKLTSVEPGFRAENVLSFAVALPQTSYKDNPSRIVFFDQLLERLRAAPGVLSAAIVQQIPISGDYMLSFNIQGKPPLTPAESPSANHRVVSPWYFATLGIPVLRGRDFTQQDADNSPMVALVDEAFVTRHFPSEDPIGRGIDIGNGTDGFYQIVGVVGSVHHEGLQAPPAPTMYVPYKQDVFSGMSVLVRTSGEPLRFVSTARQIVHDIDRTLPAYSIAPLTTIIGDSVAARRFSMLLLVLFAGIALFLAAVGLYGVVAYAVSQRTQEIGLRMAIGADRGTVLRLVFGNGLKLAVIGVILGILGALSLTRVVASMLFEVTPFDPASYVGTVALLLAVAAVACYLPARRAMRVDPLVALRQP
jgi:putative ABC transport system permease protein